MNDARTTLRSLAIYAICIPLALVLGYMLANPLDMGSFTLMGGVFLVIAAPLLLRYHYPVMLLAWNSGAYLFFLPGRLSLWLAAICASFAIAFTHRIMDKKIQFLSVPQLARPFIALAVAVVGTMILRGGIGLRSLGGQSYGGRYYIYVLVAIVGYFALTTRRIPRARANLYVGLFLLSTVVSVLSDLYGKLPGGFDFLFLFIPPAAMGPTGAVISRLGGLATAAAAICSYLLARFGIRAMLAPRRKHLFALFCMCGFVALFGGFRSILIFLMMIFIFQFWLEGLFRTKWVAIFGMTFVLVATATVPFVTRLPLSIQRTLAFLPIKVDPQASLDAATSSEWRLEMWRAALPEIPGYLLLGKGYGFSRQEFDTMSNSAITAVNAEDRGSFIAGDYHSGPLSVIITFGIWGTLAFLWIVVAGFRVLWRNHRYGDPELRTINAFLLAVFTARILMFFAVVGALNSDLVAFAGYLGLSVALNGGVAGPGRKLGAASITEPGPPETQKREVPRRLGLG